MPGHELQKAITTAVVDRTIPIRDHWCIALTPMKRSAVLGLGFVSCFAWMVVLKVCLQVCAGTSDVLT